jgi:hypothetical protein
MRIKTLDDDGNEKWTLLSDLIPEQPPVEPPVTPPSSDVLFFDDFKTLSIEDGQAPTKGATWADSFVKWGVRRLANPPNLDQGVKQYIDGVTHKIGPNGLSLLAQRRQNETGYAAGMISSERSRSFLPGCRFDIEMTVKSNGAGGHFTNWLMPVDGSTDVEYDLTELAGSNKNAPNGPLPMIFMNAKTPSVGGFTWYNVDDGFLAGKHLYSFIWRESGLEWLLDGVKIHEADNLYSKPLYFMASWEVGGSENGDFPGPINSSTPWPLEVILHSIKVTKA